jgi:HSP20 family protein
MKCSTNRNLSTPISDIASEVEQMFDRFLGKPLAASMINKDGFVPSLDISESETDFQVHIDLPGVKPEDVKLEIHDDRLSISGKRESMKTSEGKNFHRVERSSGEFFRTVVLPQSVDQENIEANFHDGVLDVRLPKSVKNQPRKIEIKSTSGR